LVPEAVERELRRKPEGTIIFSDNPWIKATEVKNTELVKVLMLVVDEGEAEAIALALHSSARILIDEKSGRNVARKLGLEIKECMDELLEAGYSAKSLEKP